MIYITVELNQDIYIKIPKVKEGISPYNLTMTSQAGGQQMVFADLVDNSDKSSVYRFTLNFTQYTPSGIYNYVLVDSADKVMSKGLIQVNMNNTDDYFYADDELGYFVEEEGSGGDMSNYYTKSQVDSMLTQYEKKSDLPDFNNFVTEEELGEYVTSEELQEGVKVSDIEDINNDNKEHIEIVTPWLNLQVGDRVIHKSWGEGTISMLDDKYMKVKFDVIEKKFLYPSCFEQGFFVI